MGIALGYEDLNDHEQLRHDPLLGAVIGCSPDVRACALAGKSTLNRLERFQAQGSSRYHKIRPQAGMIEDLFVDLFLDAHRRPPEEIILDLDATDDPLHGQQEGRFFHGYYGVTVTCRCTSSAAVTCCAPSCARPTSMAPPGAGRGATHRQADSRRWPDTRIVLRADSGSAGMT